MDLQACVLDQLPAASPLCPLALDVDGPPWDLHLVHCLQFALWTVPFGQGELCFGIDVWMDVCVCDGVGW